MMFEKTANTSCFFFKFLHDVFVTSIKVTQLSVLAIVFENGKNVKLVGWIQEQRSFLAEEMLQMCGT